MDKIESPRILLSCMLPLTYLVPHPRRRAIDKDWVKELQGMFEEGVHKTACPLWVIPDKFSKFSPKMDERARNKLTYRVLDGQHRIEAYKAFMREHKEEKPQWYCHIIHPGL